MLPVNCIYKLKAAAETKDPEIINEAIELVKLLAPQYFFKTDSNGKDIDPELNNRVFYHMPRGSTWSGTFITADRIPRNNYEY
jgi:hypothetical protein